LRDDRAYRNLAQVKSITRLLEGKTHHLLLDPYRPSPHSPPRILDPFGCPQVPFA
jgi:hypothetical protein